MRGFRIRTCSQGGWSPGRAPGQLRPRCRSRTPLPSIRAGREVESGRVMACPGCGQVKLPLTAFVKEFASKRFDRHGLGDCYQANARRSAGWLCLVGQLRSSAVLASRNSPSSTRRLILPSAIFNTTVVGTEMGAAGVVLMAAAMIEKANAFPIRPRPLLTASSTVARPVSTFRPSVGPDDQ